MIRSEQMARILVKRTEIFRGRFEETYEWQGEPHWPVEIGGYYWRQVDESPADIVARLPWPMTLVREFGEFGAGDIYMRTDGRNWWHARWTVARYAVAKRWGWFARRLILTLMVWGLAYVGEAEVITWSAVGKKPPEWRR